MVKKLIKKSGIDISYYIKNGTWTTFEQVVKIATGLILSILFARLVSQQTYGEYQLIISLLTTASVISIPGINTSIFTQIAKRPSTNISPALRLRLLWATAGIPILLAITGYLAWLKKPSSLTTSLLIAAILFPLLSTLDTWKVYNQATKKFKSLAIFSTIELVVNLLLIGTAILFTSKQTPILIAAYACSFILTNGIFHHIATRHLKKKNTAPKDDWKSYGYFLTKINALNIAISRIDGIIVAAFLGVEQLAIYTIGYKFSKNIYELLKSLLVLPVPKIATKNTVSLKKYLIAFGIVSAFTTAILLATQPVMNLLYTSKYEESIRIAQIIIAFAPFFVIQSLYSNHFHYFVQNKKILLWHGVITPLLRLATLLAAITTFGLIGLAAAEGAKNILSIIVLFVLAKAISKKPTKH